MGRAWQLSFFFLSIRTSYTTAVLQSESHWAQATDGTLCPPQSVNHGLTHVKRSHHKCTQKQWFKGSQYFIRGQYFIWPVMWYFTQPVKLSTGSFKARVSHACLWGYWWRTASEMVYHKYLRPQNETVRHPVLHCSSCWLVISELQFWVRKCQSLNSTQPFDQIKYIYFISAQDFICDAGQWLD